MYNNSDERIGCCYPSKKAGFFILLDMLIALMISMIFLMMFYSGLQRVYLIKASIEELSFQRNLATEILTSKQDYVEKNNLEKDRSYEIKPGIFVDIYHIEFEEHIQKKYGLEKLEFGIVEERKGE